MEPTIGFTGTSNGMTNAQMTSVKRLVDTYVHWGATVARHGVCIGADEEFHQICRQVGHLYIIGHPGITSKGLIYKRSKVECDEMLEAKFFLDRNDDIVVQSTILIATPKEVIEQMRSGTWSTVRRARDHQVPYAIVFPNGEIRCY